MKHFLLLLFIIPFLSASAQNKNSSFYRTAPKKYTPVNDFAGMLSTDEKRSLSKALKNYKDSTGNVLVIITQSNLTDPVTNEVYGIEEAALHYFNKWGIGDKEQNNGVLIFVAKADRKVRITTGKGIEDILTNDDCQQIIDGSILPAFKKQQYGEGLTAAAQAIMDELSPAEPATVEQSTAEPVTTSYTYTPNEIYTENSAATGFGVFALVSVIGGFILLLFRNLRSPGVDVYTGSDPFVSYPRRGFLDWFNSGYHHHHYDNRSSDSFSSSSSSDSFSSNSSFSDSSSSSSLGGGSSDGGGASGSW